MALVDAGGVLPPAETDLFRGRLLVRESTTATAGKVAAAGSRKRAAAAGKRGVLGEGISLFDGNTLTGWHAAPRVTAPRSPREPMPVLDEATSARIYRPYGRWTVEGGAICGRQEPPGSGLGAYLISDKTFGDFELSFEARRTGRRHWHHVTRHPTGVAGLPNSADHRKSGNIGGFYGNGIGRFHAINFNLDVVRDPFRPSDRASA